MEYGCLIYMKFCINIRNNTLYTSIVTLIHISVISDRPQSHTFIIVLYPHTVVAIIL